MSIYKLEEYNREIIISNFKYLSLDLQRQWLTLRREFMHKEMDWHVENDFDEYDADAKTLQLIMLNSTGGISAGMRITPRSSITKTLSWSMLSKLPGEKIS